MKNSINGYTENDLKNDYDKGLLEGYDMAIADFNIEIEKFCEQIEDPPTLREVALQAINKAKTVMADIFEMRRDSLLLALAENPNKEG